MAIPRVCVLRAPGTNCDVETAFAFETCGGTAERVHLFRMFERPSLLDTFQILCLPGGFSYGDDVGAGVVFGDCLQSRLGEALARFLDADKLVLGICNGFQVLLKAGILPDGRATRTSEGNPQRSTTLTWNTNGKYTALWVTIDVHSPENVFLRGMERFELPVAHAEGRLALENADQMTDLRARRQIALCYADPNQPGAGDGTDSDALPYPLNPNGSIANVAGLSDPSGRILGLMPHPERFLFRTQHPRWTRRDAPSSPAGRQIFANAVDYFRST